MKRNLILFAFLLLALPSPGQDLLVTQSRDSIDCLIIGSDKDQLCIKVDRPDGVSETRYIDKADVHRTRLGYFRYGRNAEGRSGAGDYPVFTLGVDAGYGCRLGNALPGFAVAGKRNGFTIGADANWYVTEAIGLGAAVRWRHFSGYDVYYEGAHVDGVNSFFLGPQFSARLLSRSNRNALVFNYAVGIATMSQTGNLAPVPVTLRNAALGNMFSLGYSIGCTPRSSVQLKASVLLGSRKATFHYRNENQGWNNISHNESISSVNFTVGYVFGK